MMNSLVQVVATATVLSALVKADENYLKCKSEDWNKLAQLRSDQANAIMKCNPATTALEDMIDLNVPNIRKCFCTSQILDGLIKIAQLEDNCAMPDAANHTNRTITAWQRDCGGSVADSSPTVSSVNATPGPGVGSSSQSSDQGTSTSSASTSTAASLGVLSALGYGALAPGFVIAVLVGAVSMASFITL